MNKTVILFLAVCILSTHAFTHVKRETAVAPAESDAFKEFVETARKAFNPENFEKGIRDGLTTIQKGIEDLKTKFDGQPTKA